MTTPHTTAGVNDGQVILPGGVTRMAPDESKGMTAAATAVPPAPAVVPTHGMCTACGSIEVALVKATGTRDFSAIGEHHAYPTGYGCEVCS